MLETGINIEEMYMNLNNFKSATENIVQKFADASREFADNIIQNWASPNAIKFSKEFTYKLIDISVLPNKEFDSILQDAAYAASNMAVANGAKFDTSNYEIKHPYSMYYSHGLLDEMKEISFDGKVGMNIEAVKLIVENFKTQITATLVMMENIPNNIALYDSSGDLKESFRIRIDKAVNSINEIVDNIQKAINNYMVTEQQAIIRGVTQASNVLSS